MFIKVKSIKVTCNLDIRWQFTNWYTHISLCCYRREIPLIFMPFSFPKNIPLSCNRSLFPKKNFIFRHSFKFISTKLAPPYPLPYLNIPHAKPPTYKISDSTREGTSSVCIGGRWFCNNLQQKEPSLLCQIYWYCYTTWLLAFGRNQDWFYQTRHWENEEICYY